MAYILFDNGGGTLATLNIINDLNNLPSTISPVSTTPSFYDNTRFIVSAADDSTFAVVTMNPTSALLDIYSNTGVRNRICEFTMDNVENFSSFGFNSAQNEYVYVTFTVTTAPNVGTYKVYFVPNNSCSSTSLTLQENTTNNAPFFLSGIYIE